MDLKNGVFITHFCLHFCVIFTSANDAHRFHSRHQAKDMSSRDKIRILCLHGYRQSAKIFKNRIGSFRKLYKNEIEFHFIDAPNIIPNAENERGWFLIEKDLPCPSSQNSNVSNGFEKSLNYLKDYLKDHNQNEGPFDGLLGFSQGATLIAALCSVLNEEGVNAGFKFVILIAGYKYESSNVSPAHSVFFKQTIHIPSLHVIGESDRLVSKERGEELRDCFDKSCSSTIIHDGGHYVPARRHLKPDFIAFLDKYMRG